MPFGLGKETDEDTATARRESQQLTMRKMEYSPNTPRVVVQNIKATLNRIDKKILRAAGVTPGKIKTPGDADRAVEAVQVEIAKVEKIRPGTPQKKRSDLHAVYLHLGALRDELY